MTMKYLVVFALLVAMNAMAASHKASSKVAPKEENTEPVMSEMKDTRDGRIYKTVKIGDQEWMAENLNFNDPQSFCYDDRFTLCKTNGRLYTWLGAMNIPDRYKGERYTSKLKKNHQGICPVGWHVPTNAEWASLAKAVSAVKDTCNEDDVCAWTGVGKALKAASGWETEDGDSSANGENTAGFAAIPSGRRDMISNYEFMGEAAMYWSVNEGVGNTYDAYHWGIKDDMLFFDAGYKNEGYAVRCVRN